MPIFYSLTIIAPQYRPIYELNPVAALVMILRTILLEGKPPVLTTLFKLTFGDYSSRRRPDRVWETEAEILRLLVIPKMNAIELQGVSKSFPRHNGQDLLRKRIARFLRGGNRTASTR